MNSEDIARIRTVLASVLTGLSLSKWSLHDLDLDFHAGVFDAVLISETGALAHIALPAETVKGAARDGLSERSEIRRLIRRAVKAPED